jgi:hypothetical protein
LIWPATFSARLDSWNLLREQCKNLSPKLALTEINQWWFRAPWRPYYLHWDDQAIWPDPWQLLSDDIYCELARGLGILYTITLLDRAELAPADLILTQDDVNLVRVGKEKYILNWEADTVVNTNLEFTIQRQYQQQQIA